MLAGMYAGAIIVLSVGPALMEMALEVVHGRARRAAASGRGSGTGISFN